MSIWDESEQVASIRRLSEIGVALTNEIDPVQLQETILTAAKDLIGCDAGSIYEITPEKELKFVIILNDTLETHMGGRTGAPIEFPAVPLYHENGTANMDSVVAHSAVLDVTINIPDAYDAEGFDFSGTREFDRNTGYRSKSFLTVPMKNHEGEIIGVLQLINSLSDDGQDILPFSDEQQLLAESLASQAAMALTRNQLIDDMSELFESFIKLIASAIDDKSPYTGGHCRRVPELTLMLADAVADIDRGPLKSFRMSEEDRHELSVAGWLHDCGKITTPEWVMDKATKLQTIFDRIELVDTRLEVLRRDAEIARLKGIIAGGNPDQLSALYREQIATIEADRAFLHRVNIGAEYMADVDIDRINNLQQIFWEYQDMPKPLLTEEEAYNLSIRKGTLTKEERGIINGHMDSTIKMLESLPYPKNLSRVPEFAGGHHERMDGKGYPRGLRREEMSVQARVMGIADVFEALTAADRPYKKAMPLSQALFILGKMKLDNHIDPDIFDVFINEKVYLKYAEEYLKPEQIDHIDHTLLPGYNTLD